MSDSRIPEKYDPKTLLGKALVDLDKIELPEMIEKNLIRSACRLITGIVDIPVAWLKAVERNISRETEALDLISKSNAKDIAELNSQDLEFIRNSSDYYSLKLFKETSNRRTLLRQTVNELKENPPTEDSRDQIDEDWLNLFTRISEIKSNEEVLLIFSKILAGEIKQPGKFSPNTLHLLGYLDSSTASRFIEMSKYACRTLDPFMSDPFVLRFDYKLITEGTNYNPIPTSSIYKPLQDIGLLRAGKEQKSIRKTFKNTRVILGDELLFFDQNLLPVNTSMELLLEVVSFSTAGKELLEVIGYTKCPIGYSSYFELLLEKEVGLKRILVE